MAFKWEAKDTQFFVDQENKMMLIQNHVWDPNGNNGQGDSIGRSFLAYFTYGDDRFLEGIENCWVKVERKNRLKRFLFGKYYYQGYRYPTHYDEDMSRDHLIYSLLTFKYAGYSEEFIQDFVKHLRFRISKRYLFTLNTWLWTRVIANIKPYKALYFPIQWLIMVGYSLWNRALYKYAGFKEESHQDDFVKIDSEFKPKIMVRLAKKLFPIFSLHQTAWGIRVLENSKWKKRLQKIALSLCPKHNYVIQLLLQSPNPPSLEDIKSYESMTGGRWTGILNPWINNRDIEIIKDPKKLEWNVQDVDYLRKLYSTIVCKDI